EAAVLGSVIHWFKLRLSFARHKVIMRSRTRHSSAEQLLDRRCTRRANSEQRKGGLDLAPDVPVRARPRRKRPYTRSCDGNRKDILSGDVRLPDECARLRKGNWHAQAAGLPAGGQRRGGGSDPLQHLFDTRQGGTEGLPPAQRLQGA